MSRWRALTVAVILLVALLWRVESALAQPGVPPAPPAGSGPPAAAAPAAGEISPEAKREAAERYLKGKKLYDQGAWDAALAEYQASRKLYPREANTLAAAICLKRLLRFEEALDLVEVLLRDFAETMSAKVKDTVQREVVELRGLVGTIDVKQAEPGAAITVDGQSRGDYPLLAPIRVIAGSHGVRVYKEGFEPFESRVTVAGGTMAPVVVRLRRLKETGTLQVSEALGRELAVVVDGIEVGKTRAAPLLVPLSPGKHGVLLRGEGHLGTMPASVTIRVNEVELLRIEAEVLDASLRVEPTPFDALVSVDSTNVGHGAWDGRLRPGRHTIEVAAEGFLPEKRTVLILHEKREVLTVSLPRDPKSPFWREPPPPPHFVVEMGTGALLVPSFGGDVAGTCAEACSGGVGVGSYSVLRGGYRLSSGLGFGVSLGALTATQKTSGRRTELNIVGDPSKPTSATATMNDTDTTAPGKVDDVLKLRGLWLGGWVGYAIDAGVPIQLRLGAGGLFGSVSDARSGAFTAQKDMMGYAVGTYVQTQPARFVFVTPEVRVGLPLGRHVELNLGLELPMLFAVSRPRWSDTDGVHAGRDGYGWFSADALLSGVLVTVAPTVGVRFDL